MAYTGTSTFTTAYIIGDSLVEKHKLLRPAYEEMLRVSNEFEKELHASGLELEKTDDLSDLETMRFQWKTVLPRIIPKAKEIYELIPESVE